MLNEAMIVLVVVEWLKENKEFNIYNLDLNFNLKGK
jgi:hypothetical protein